MDPRPHTPGDGSTEPLLADEPLPPGSNAEDIVDDLDKRIREGGSEEIEEADAKADAVEDTDTRADEPAASDAGPDPSDDDDEATIEPPD